MARLWYPPAAMATALVSDAGTLHCPLKPLPQAKTAPFGSKARLCQSPPAIATALLAGSGAFSWPKELSPTAWSRLKGGTTSVVAVASTEFDEEPAVLNERTT